MASILGPDISKGIGQLLHEKRLRVPTFQRSYAWKKQQVLELFHDLRRAIDNNRQYYFLGSIVGCEDESNPDSAEIVDGQQRLATTTILLAAIRDQLIALDDSESAARFESEILFKTEGFMNPKTEPRLTLSEADDEFFRKRILSRPGTRERLVDAARVSHRLILDAAKQAELFVKEIAGSRADSEKKGQFDRWNKFIRHGARVIFILVPDQADAFMVFETLNDRGLELTIADLTKNYLFSRGGKNNLEKMKHSWTRMVSTLVTSTESEIAKTYIHHLWSSIHGVTREREMFGDIRNTVNSEEKAVEFAGQLEQKAVLYEATRNPESDYWKPYGPRTRTHITILNRLKVSQVRMLLLAALDKFKQAEIEKIMPCCVWWSVRFSIAGGSPSEVESYYAKRAVEIRSSAIKSADDLIRSMAEVVPNDAQFEVAFADESSSPTSKPIARYYLQCLQRANDGVQDAHLGEDNELIGSLEHILPLNPDASWKIIEQDAERLVWRLGNLALLSKDENNSRKNLLFPAAKAVYANCASFSLTKDLASVAGDWNESEINKRQVLLAKLAVKTWPSAPPMAKKKGKK